jgi:hypothetical protein
MREWLNRAVSKTVKPVRVSGVRIPLSPERSFVNRCGGSNRARVDRREKEAAGMPPAEGEAGLRSFHDESDENRIPLSPENNDVFDRGFDAKPSF